MLLSRPGTRLNVIDRRDIRPPGRLPSHLIEFAILNHHRMNDAQETLVTRKDARSSSESVTLEETLACML